jgi:thiol:disulfide interchange protein DsbD
VHPYVPGRSSRLALSMMLVCALLRPASAADPGQVLEATATATPTAVGPGDAAELTVTVTLKSGWHVNAHVPSEPYLIPTELSITAPPEIDVGDVGYPVGEQRTFAFNPKKPLATYEGTFTLTAGLRVRDDATVGRGTLLRSTLRYLACNDTRCLPPRTVDVVARLQITTAPGAAGSGTSSLAAPASTMSGAGDLTAFASGWLARGDALAYLGVFFLGLLLNLTPCVYPLIAVTVAFFGGQAGGSRARVIGLAVVYVLGISITFSALGIVSAMSGSAFGMALQQPPVLVLVAAMLLALAASNFGLYQLRVPALLSQWAGRSGSGFGGVLFMGLTMGLIAAPCVGPVLAGLLLIVGTRQDVLFGFSMFFVLSIGMGAPYVLLATAANAARGLPRSGGWLAWMEKLLGFVLVGLALFYVEPLLPEGSGAVAWVALLAVAGLYLGFVDPTGSDSARFGYIKRAVGVTALAAAVWTAGGGSEATSPITWQRFSPEALAAARRSGTPAVVDFTADWCIPCREMDASTFMHPQVVQAAGAFKMLRADVTVTDAETDEVMRKHSVLGVPTYLFFSSSGDEAERLVGYVPSDEFLRAMRAAGGTS